MSPARGDYKVYQNLDESLFIKDFFIHELGLSLAANKDDFFTLAKSSSTEYFLSYIPNSSDLGKFISKNNLSGKIIDVQKEELDGAANQSFNANTQLSGIPLQRVVFGAPGTGKSFTINKQSSPFEDQKKISKDKKDEIRNAIAEAITKSRKLTLLNSIGFKYSDELKSIQRKDLSSYCEYDKIDELYIGSNAKPISDEIQIEKDEQLTDIDFIKDLIQNKKGGNDSLKWANAIGFKFGDFLKDWTLDELRKTFELSEPQMWWIYRGAQASQIRSSEIETEIKYVERVTFHPNYSYAQFVGTYKPVQDSDDKKQIKYEYVPGPFMRMYCAAKKNSNNDFLLIIEEINRANVAAVFGDVFQLLDRKNGVSEYPIAASEDIRNFLADNGINEKELCIPSNMYIWATMNSADQGVFPMDTAFKRRWEFEYIGIDDNQEGIEKYDIPVEIKKDADGKVIGREWVKWNDLRHSINDKLTEMKINEDKLLGPYFISEEKLKLVEGKKEDNADEFVKSFKSKVLMYLFEDAVKMRPGDLFDENAVGKLRFSDICKKFDEIGQGIFNFKK
ncbi:AAA family ATPase [Fibrobacter sp. UWB11]|uniref:AAA family ATPase n=1 Tax=Fibrobacter sp. UWB11 TaxID=1896202 RepID=UPI0009261798|nr:AAA family ATPase [Fibrobacter sp. UWB11]SIO30924.1 AAA domain (dynein-related subfamily) [Fibrobacter sp. UWB11]